MSIEFDGRSDRTGFEIHDSIEQRHILVKTAERVEPERSEDVFCFPIDRACSVETSSLVFDKQYFVSLHDLDGRCVESLETGDSIEFDGSDRFVGLNGPIQMYCRVETPGNIELGIGSTHLTFDERTEVIVGARSLHDRPAGTIRTTEDPEPMARAISALPSALKTTSPERAWPSLRGHPPLVELADEFELPAGLEPPETDVTIEVSPDPGEIYTVSPLAFYLGSEVRVGAEPRLVTPEFERVLGNDELLEDEVAKLLKQVLLLDCVVRTEGLFPTDLYERARLEERLPFEPAEAYELPMADRLERYLSVPYEDVEAFVPRWPLTAHVPAEPESVELLPFIINELGIIRSPRGHVVERSTQVPDAEAGLVRSASSTRSPEITAAGGNQRFVIPEVHDESIEHAWFDDEIPQIASKATIEAYRSQLEHDSRSDSIELLLVCNDARMIDEHDLLDETYGNRESLPFDVESEFGIDTEGLRALLTEGGYDFFHFIGHATPDGLHCSDGKLDVRSLESVDLGVFFLNACRSYEQALALVRRGAFGGVGTLSDVINDQAVTIGETIARLLNLGFPLRAALEIARENSILGEQYLIVGDGSADIAQSEGGAPIIADIRTCGDDQFEFSVRSYQNKEFKLGTTTSSNLRQAADRHLSPGRTPPTCVSEESLQQYLIWADLPIMVDGDLRWCDGIGPAPID